MKLPQWVCLFVVACATMSFGQMAQPAAKASVADTLNGYMKNAESEVSSAADAMPEDKYSFAPTSGAFKGVRTFEQQVKHVAAVNYILGAAILQEKAPVDVGGENGPDAVKSKAEIAKFLKDSFAYLHKAMSSVTSENMLDTLNNPFGQGTMSRMQIVLIAEGHPWDHYGQIVEYLRMNGIVPPGSR